MRSPFHPLGMLAVETNRNDRFFGECVSQKGAYFALNVCIALSV